MTFAVTKRTPLMLALIFCISLSIGIWLMVLSIGFLKRHFKVQFEFDFTEEIDFESEENRSLLVQILINQSDKINLNKINEVNEIYLPKISKKRPFVLFTLGSNSDEFAKAIIQGEDEKYKVELKKEDQKYLLSFEYEAESLWKKGCQSLVWPSISKIFIERARSSSTQFIKIEREEAPFAKEEETISNNIELKENKLRVLKTSYIDIPVSDIARAKWFYTGVFGFEFMDEARDDFWISHFKYVKGEFLGALTFGNGYIPQTTGADVFIHVLDPALAYSLIYNYGGKVLIEYRNVNGQNIVKFIDSEGNRLGLIS